ncbi:hypothetical protein J4225_01140 [Candidatus Pacearchaeota archaeon]|nr:hypothetical protein [Candidatus Pacearchaeota archaeon]
MPQQDAQEIRRKILLALRIKGPSLPVHIAHEVSMSMLFASAFLAELVSEKEVKMSHMKVGGSPIYLLSNQEPLLERYSHFLKSKERDAYLILKQKGFLLDKAQEPAIRVALRAIRDFAAPFKHEEEIYWRFFTVPQTEFKPEEKIEQKQIQQVQEPVITKKPIQLITPMQTPIQKMPLQSTLQPIEQQKSIIEIKPKAKKPKQPKEKSAFIEKTLKFMQANDIELITELEIKKKEFTGIARINSDLGKIELFVIAKDKKKITEDDITLAAQKSQSNRRIVLILSTGELDKKAEAYIGKYHNIIKFLKT